MGLVDRFRKTAPVQVATAIHAIPATDGGPDMVSVAGIAAVAVANPKSPKGDEPGTVPRVAAVDWLTNGVRTPAGLSKLRVPRVRVREAGKAASGAGEAPKPARQGECPSKAGEASCGPTEAENYKSSATVPHAMLIPPGDPGESQDSGVSEQCENPLDGAELNGRDAEMRNLRLHRLLAAGLTPARAEAAADRLTARDADLDDRRMCAECSYYGARGRCIAAATGRLIGAARDLQPIPDMLQRCEGFGLRKGLS